MTNLLAARCQMALSLGFHIVFAAVGIAMPLLMIIAEGLWLRTGDGTYLTLARRWSKGTAIMFAVGAVSGTVLSFELGLLWPPFMAFAGPIVGLPFALEGFAFFIEAIFLGIYLYGWERVPPGTHWLAGVLVLLSGTFSGLFVVTANAWMNTPAGFAAAGRRVVRIDPLVAMFNPAALSEALHMTLAAFLAVGFMVAAIHARMLLQDPQNLFHLRAFGIALAVGGVAAVLQPLSGDISAKQVAKHQPVKLAAMEGQWETRRGAPLRIGGWPDETAEVTRYALEIPFGLSFLAHFDPHAQIAGLKGVPRPDRPPVAVVHVAFQVMVAAGLALTGAGLLGGWLTWRYRRLATPRWFLWLIMLCGPLGFIAMEAGWTVTEVGRQPWIIRGVMRTSEAVTPMPALVVPLTVFSLIYVFLALTVFTLLRRQVFQSPRILPSGDTGDAA